jgi:hypothetical protein
MHIIELYGDVVTMDEANENRIIFLDIQDAESDWKDYFWGMREVRYTEREVNIGTIIAYVFAPIFEISTGEIFYGKIKVGSSTCILNGTFMLSIDPHFDYDPTEQKIGIYDIANQGATPQIRISDFKFDTCCSFDQKKIYVVYWKRARINHVRESNLYGFVSIDSNRHLKAFRKDTECLFCYDGNKFCNCSAESSKAHELFRIMVSLQQGKSFDKTEAKRMQESIDDAGTGLLQSIFGFRGSLENEMCDLDPQQTIPQYVLHVSHAAPQTQITTSKPPVITDTTQDKENEAPLIHKREDEAAWLYILFGVPLCFVGAAAICILNLGLFPVSKLFLGIGIALSSIFILIGLRNAFIERIDQKALSMCGSTDNKFGKLIVFALSSLPYSDIAERNSDEFVK